MIFSIGVENLNPRKPNYRISPMDCDPRGTAVVRVMAAGSDRVRANKSRSKLQFLCKIGIQSYAECSCRTQRLAFRLTQR